MNEIIQEEIQVEKRKLLKINLAEYLCLSEEKELVKKTEMKQRGKIKQRWEQVQYGVVDAQGRKNFKEKDVAK